MSDTAMFLAGACAGRIGEEVATMWPDFSDPIVVNGAFCFIGWLAGVGFVLALFWRRLSKPADGTVRLLRMQIDDAAVHAARQQAIIDELTAEVGQLYGEKERLARRYVELAASRTRGMVT